MSSPLEDLSLAIQRQHRERVFLVDQRKRAVLALGAYVRTSLGWQKDLPKPERDAITKQAAEILAFGAKPVGEPPAYFNEFAAVVMTSIAAQQPMLDLEEKAAESMAKLAMQLPVWDGFGRDIKGFGAPSLAVIVGEATSDDAPTLGEYRTKGGLWKRMGIATVDGIAQGKLLKTAKAETWLEHGYNASRRSRMWNVGESLIKHNRDGVYRQLYLARKELERQRAADAGLTVMPAAKITTKNRAIAMADGHIHRRAQRVMEQKLLTDLWKAWRRLERNHAGKDLLQSSPRQAEIMTNPPSRVAL